MKMKSLSTFRIVLLLLIILTSWDISAQEEAIQKIEKQISLKKLAQGKKSLNQLNVDKISSRYYSRLFRIYNLLEDSARKAQLVQKIPQTFFKQVDSVSIIIKELYQEKDYAQGIKLTDKGLTLTPNHLLLLKLKVEGLCSQSPIDTLIYRYRNSSITGNADNIENQYILFELEIKKKELEKKLSFDDLRKTAAYFYDKGTRLKSISDSMNIHEYKSSGLKIEKEAFEILAISLDFYERGLALKKDEFIESFVSTLKNEIHKHK